MKRRHGELPIKFWLFLLISIQTNPGFKTAEIIRLKLLCIVGLAVQDPGLPCREQRFESATVLYINFRFEISNFKSPASFVVIVPIVIAGIGEKRRERRF